jgi:hypothetical protein
MANEEQAEDKKLLIDMLVTIEKRLYVIVFAAVESAAGKSGFRAEFVRMLPEPWREVEHAFVSARNMIEKEELNWEYVEGIGMTGHWLRWKKGMLDESVKEGTVGRFLKFANAILGSLAKVIPPQKYFRG